METDVSEVGNAFSVEDMTLDPDLNDPDNYGVPDPGLLEERGEPAWPSPRRHVSRIPKRLGQPRTHRALRAGARAARGELSFTKLVPKLFLRSSWRRGTAPSARARARLLWLLLRRSLRNVVEKEKRSELRVARLTHGLEPLRRLEVAAGLRSVAQDPAGRRFVVLDGAGCLHLHREDGWALGTLPAPVALTGLVAVRGPLGSMSRFVGWGPAGLAILKPDLSLLWLSEPRAGRPPRREPICCLPVPDLRLLLVAEAGGGLALWKFRLEGRCLLPCGPSLQPQLSCAGALTRLALGPLTPNYIPRCFAAYGSAVLTFDLRTWTVTDVRQDLHKTTISDLAYCGEMEAMVTASRDSTVKVWGADWQIRMVFVGHTGPVTAMAVLPNTTLVLSASGDGTLRTWDLQAVAQVGEVMLSYWGQSTRSESVNQLLAPASPGWPVLSVRAGSVELWCLRELYSPLAQLSAPILHLQVAPELPLSPYLPARLVCACTDGSVYLVNPETGRTVSALLLGPEDCAAAVAYCLPREVLWLLTRAGHLVRANAACSPMRLLLRKSPLPRPAPRPCCLHLYSHLTDPRSAFSSWETVRQHKGEVGHSDIRTWKEKNRYLPLVGHTDGTLSVLSWHTLEPVFHTEAHSPGPVTAIASTWNSVVSSGGDLTVKMWRMFPYSEESLSPLRTFSCCHPALALCALRKNIMVAFEDPDSATYGLVQFGLRSSQRYDHRPQDDHLDHITGLCCCPTLKLYASSSLDCTMRIWTTENRLLRLLQLNGAPQALTFSSNNGDLVLALGSRLCLVSHRLYLPTTYLVKKLCQKPPDGFDDLPLPLTTQESLTSVQLQRLASLHGVASLSSASRPAEPTWRLPPSCPGSRSGCVPPVSQHEVPGLPGPWGHLKPVPALAPPPPRLLCPLRGLATLLNDCPGLSPVPLSVPPIISVCSSALSFIRHWTAVPQQPLLKEDLEPLLARDQDLQQLRRGQVVPAAPAPLSWKQQLEAFDNYLYLVYGPALLGMHPRTESQQWTSMAITVEKNGDVSTLPGVTPSLAKAGVCTHSPKMLPPRDRGALSRRFPHPPRVTLPIPRTHQREHSRASQLLAHSSLSSLLGLSMDLQLQSEQLRQETPAAPEAPSSHLKHRVPLLLERRPQELLSDLGGFFPASVQHYKNLQRPIRFPGWVPNSVALQQMWLPQEVSGLGHLPQLTARDSSKARGGAGARPWLVVLSPLQPAGSQEDLWLLRGRQPHTRSQIQWSDEGDEDLDLDLDLELDWTLDYPLSSPELSQELLTSAVTQGRAPSRAAVSRVEREAMPSVVTTALHATTTIQKYESLAKRRIRETTARTETFLRRHQHRLGHSLWELRYGHLPRFLRFFVIQNWFKKLFPIFTLEAYPEVGTVDGLASRLMDLLKEASWEDRVHILRALLRLLPEISKTLYKKLQETLKYLLNLDEPPNLQEKTQRQFVMLALQLQLACSLESREVVLELMSYLLYSPASCRPELKKLLEGLGLQDPEGFLFREMMTWVQDMDLHCKAVLRRCCSQKLEEMTHLLQVGGGRDLPVEPLALPRAFPRCRESRGGWEALPCSRSAVLNLWVVTPLGVERPFHRGRLRPSENTYIITYCFCDAVLKGRGVRKVENRCSRSTAPVLLVPPLSGSSCFFLGGSLQRGPAGVQEQHPDSASCPHPLPSPPQVEALQPSVARLSEVLPKVSETVLSPISSGPSVHSTLSTVSWTPLQPGLPRDLDPQVQQLVSHFPVYHSHRTLSESLMPFSSVPDIHVRSSAPDAMPDHPLPLEQTDWSRSKMLDLGPIDALNFFCKQRRSCLQEVAGDQRLHALPPNAVVPQPRDHLLDPILRLQEIKLQGSAMRLRGQMLARHGEGRTLDGSIRTLKLPLPRVELRPFPVDWPRPARPLPPLLLQPALQRYFLPDLADPDFYR
ncbi:WD repeat-containing protein 97 [Myotis daubentonii]|uniref:WD repeat-containing protein 97 n=1 Tax=Myotis daubentonii TaxID=98922 RepID=UPI002872D577|nr:WD repeat-containing protein 97 [Myotis daubentonii]